ncbi:hypothetical protein [Desulfatiglans anilini]|uniref:hypothetical protein n=1 Tax=Desulfatiglans anilini TaxID=90728 RepID=UPI00129469A7|nr:hypothetical protein [Desulfatiglans anilini]
MSLIFLLLPTKNLEVNQFLFKINTYPFNNADCLTLKFQLFYNFADCFSGWQLAAATAGHEPEGNPLDQGSRFSSVRIQPALLRGNCAVYPFARRYSTLVRGHYARTRRRRTRLGQKIVWKQPESRPNKTAALPA